MILINKKNADFISDKISGKNIPLDSQTVAAAGKSGISFGDLF